MNERVAAFLSAAVWHGTLDEARAILVASPPLATSCIHTAAVLGDEATVREFLAEDPDLATARDGPLTEFAGVGNTGGVAQLLDLGVDVSATHPGDAYWDLADSTALHAAAWRSRPAVVELLLERGAPVDAADRRGRTPLMLAVRACVDSYWTERRTPQSVRALLRAGASTRGVANPSGYAEVDELLGSSPS